MDEHIRKEITGEEFNKLTKGQIKCKMLNEKWNHYDFQYKLGLNIDTNEFSPRGSCDKGGLYFTIKNNIFDYLYAGKNYAVITIPDDARVYVEEGKFKANKLNIISVKPIDCVEFPLEILMSVIQENGFMLCYMKDQTPEMCMTAVKQDGLALQYVKKQSKEICLAAIQQNGLALEYVKEQTPEVCMAAVQQNGFALQHVKEQTPEICMAAVKQDEWAFQYVKEQTPEICIAARIKKWSGAGIYVRTNT